MDFLEPAKRTIEIEIRGLQNVLKNLDEEFSEVINSLRSCKGKVVITGMGKSGLIAHKIAATLASTGTPSFYMHPGEALHGDLGMISKNDMIVLLSYSGETEELLRMLAFLDDNENKTLSITGNPESTLAVNTDFHINAAVPEEACPLKLAPTSSTTAALAIGDAIAMALMEAKGFKAEDFARFHPGGSLGRKLLTKIKDVMRTESLPFVKDDISPVELLIRISEGKLGLAIIGDEDNVQGIITDGDLRRGIIKYGSMESLEVKSVMTTNPLLVDENTRLSDAEMLMKEKKIATLLVNNTSGKLSGVYQIFNSR